MKITKLYLVRDPSKHSTFGDIFSAEPIDTYHGLPAYTIGTGLSAWKKENTTLYTDEAEARRDAVRRMKRRPKE